MSHGEWNDFNDDLVDSSSRIKSKRLLQKGPQYIPERGDVPDHDDDDDHDSNPLREDRASEGGCNWGFDTNQAGSDDSNPEDAVDAESTKFISLYESYLQDKKSLVSKTKNYKSYSNDPQKALRDWFENEGHGELELETEQVGGSQFVCKLDLPIGDQDFTMTSGIYEKKRDAIHEICLDACRILDECDLLIQGSQQDDKTRDLNTRKRFSDANKEDDLVFDRTKKHCPSSTEPSSSLDKTTVNTYESLMAKWTELNMSILKLKAEMVKLDLRTKMTQSGQSTKELEHGHDACETRGDNGDDDDEVDPLDAFMSKLESNAVQPKPSLDDKIEKSRLKSQLAAYEREQSQVTRLIELAKPKFDLNKVCPPSTKNIRG